MVETIGKILKAEREAQSLSIEDVAHAMKIHPDRIRDIEDDDFSNFPNPTYARFFFRLYCRHLGVETSEELSLLAGGNLAGLDDYEYLRNEPVPLTPRTPRIRDKMSRWRRGMKTFSTAALVLAAIIAVFSGMLYYTVQRLGDWQERRQAAQEEADRLPRDREMRPLQTLLPEEVDPEAPRARETEIEAPDEDDPAQIAADEADTQRLIEDIESQRSEAEALVENENLTDDQLNNLKEIMAGPAAISEEAMAEEAGEPVVDPELPVEEEPLDAVPESGETIEPADLAIPEELVPMDAEVEAVFDTPDLQSAPEPDTSETLPEVVEEDIPVLAPPTDIPASPVP